MDASVWPAPAKLNLMLRVTGQRSDGYHLLQTVFQFLDLHDELIFHLQEGNEIQLANPIEGVPENDNLCVRAAKALQQATGCEKGVTIELNKRLPMGGGLGGGSSDAATTLVALNHLWGCRLEEEKLRRIGLHLGADVPIFIHGQAAWAEGVGEDFSPIDPPESFYLVLVPACHVSTAEIFSQPDLTRSSPRIKIRDFLQGDSRNDCLPVVRRRHPEVAEAMDWLNQYAEARLTGTGACVFAAFANEQEARSVYRALPTGVKGFVARGTNHSSLLDRLQ